MLKQVYFNHSTCHRKHDPRNKFKTRSDYPTQYTLLKSQKPKAGTGADLNTYINNVNRSRDSCDQSNDLAGRPSQKP